MKNLLCVALLSFLISCSLAPNQTVKDSFGVKHELIDTVDLFPDETGDTISSILVEAFQGEIVITAPAEIERIYSIFRSLQPFDLIELSDDELRAGGFGLYLCRKDGSRFGISLDGAEINREENGKTMAYLIRSENNSQAYRDLLTELMNWKMFHPDSSLSVS